MAGPEPRRFWWRVVSPAAWMDIKMQTTTAREERRGEVERRNGLSVDINSCVVERQL